LANGPGGLLLDDYSIRINLSSHRAYLGSLHLGSNSCRDDDFADCLVAPIRHVGIGAIRNDAAGLVEPGDPMDPYDGCCNVLAKPLCCLNL